MYFPTVDRRRGCGVKKVILETQLCDHELWEGQAHLKVYSPSGQVPGKDGDPGTSGVNVQIWWAVGGPAEAPGEVLPASGNLVL